MSRSKSRSALGRGAAVALAVALSMSFVACRLLHRKSAATSGNVAAEITSNSDFTPGAAFTIREWDLGSRIQLDIRSQSDPILYIDRDQNGIADSGDLSYAINGSSPCVRKLDANSQYGLCDPRLSHATVQVQRSSTGIKTVWIIPKSELQIASNHADLSIEIFNELLQTGQFYPGSPFEKRWKVYRIEFASSSESDVQPSIPPQSSGSGKNQPAFSTASSARAPRPPAIVEFEAIPPQISQGDASMLHWSVSNGISVEIQPGIGMVDSRGSQSVQPLQTTHFVLTARGLGVGVSKGLTLTVQPPPSPIIATFSSTKQQVFSGDTATLVWAITGRATQVTISPNYTSLPTEGKRDVQVHATTVYTLTASGPGGSVSRSLTIVATPRPPVIQLCANPASVTPGSMTTMTWNVTGADTVVIIPSLGAVPPQGSMQLRPLATANYTVIARGAGGRVTREISIPVTAPAIPRSGQIVWSGEVRGTQLITIQGNTADSGTLEGALPGIPCIVQPVDTRHVSIAAAPDPSNNFSRMILRVKGKGRVRVVLDWSTQ